MHKPEHPFFRTSIKIIKWVVLILGIVYIIYQLSRFKQSEIIIDYSDIYIWLPVLLLLMLMNWGIEAVKWKILINPVFLVTYWESFKAVLSGISVAIFTPARIGEFAGKIIHLPESLRLKGFMVSIAGNISQWMVTLIMGITAVPYLLYRFSSFTYDYPSYFFYLINIISFLACIFVLISFLQLPRLGNLLTKWKPLFKWKNDVKVWSSFHYTTLLFVLLLSCLRYLIFSFQYYILFVAFSIPVSWIDFQMLMATVFFISTLIPMFSVSEVITRGSVLVWIFQLSESPSSSVIAISFLIWVINLALPALLGYFFIVQLPANQSSDV